MHAKKLFGQITARLELINFFVFLPIAGIAEFLICDFTGKRFLGSLIALALATLINVIFVLVLRNKLLYAPLNLLYGKNQLTYNEMCSLKIQFLELPLKELKFMLVRWIIGVPSWMIFANLFMPMTWIQYVRVFIVAICCGFIGSITSYLHVEKLLVDLFIENHFNDYDVDESHYIQFGLDKKIFAAFFSLVIYISCLYFYLDYFIEKNILSPDKKILYYFFTLMTLLIVATVFSKIFISNIKKTITQIEKALRSIAEKQLNIEVVRITADELGNIGKDIHYMKNNLREFLYSISDNAQKTFQYSKTLAQSVGSTGQSISDVSTSISEVASGSANQASEAEGSVTKLSNLSEKIDGAMKNSNIVKEHVDQTEKASENGMNVIKDLMYHFDQSTKASKKFAQNVSILSDKSVSIGDIVSSITSIANQTNLLALNASIEAARAGEAGKGFAVVAEEIRKLAEQTDGATQNITNIIEEMQLEIEKIKTNVKETVNTVNDTAEVSTNAADLFDVINHAVKKIAQKVDSLVESMIKIETEKQEVFSSIENISLISEETSASMNQVSINVQGQLVTMDELSSMALNLEEISKNLKECTQQFRL